MHLSAIYPSIHIAASLRIRAVTVRQPFGLALSIALARRGAS